MKNIFLGGTALLVVGALAAFSLLAHRTTPAPAEETNQAFLTFLKQFPRTTLPYTLSKERLLQHMLAAFQAENKPDAPYDGRRPATLLNDPGIFIPSNPMAMLSRNPEYLQPEARMETADNVAVIYSVSHGYSRAFATYMVVLFDKQGRFISRNACASTDTEQITAGSIDQNLRAVITSFRINWKKDIQEYGTADNSITGLRQEATREINLKKPTEEAALNSRNIQPVPVDIQATDI